MDIDYVLENTDILESTTSGGYPNDGSTGPASDDDMPTGTTVFGDKMVAVEVNNRLTGKVIKYVPAEDLGQDWNYDEYEGSRGLGSYQAYSKTLQSFKGEFSDRMWKRTDRKKLKLATDKEVARAANDIDQTHKLSDDEEETMDITEKITRYVGNTPEPITEAVLAAGDRKSLSKAVMSGKNSKIKVKSLGVDATVTNYDDEVVITYAKNDDFTLSLVDLADSLGMEFNQTKSGSKVAFRMHK